MRYSGLQITFQEIPNQISLSIHVSGCPLACPGCHSADLWNKNKGQQLTPESFTELLQKYQGYFNCVLFMGGEWHPEQLAELLQITKKAGFKTALFTGYELHQVPKKLVQLLDYIKVGPWIAHLGGLDSPTTNQRLIDLTNNQLMIRHKTEDQPGGIRYETYQPRPSECEN